MDTIYFVSELNKTDLVLHAKLPHVALHGNYSGLIKKATDNLRWRQLMRQVILSVNQKHGVFIPGNLHCTPLGSSCPCRSLWCCSAQLWKRETAVRVNPRRAATRLISVWVHKGALCLPSEAHTDLPVAASSIGCFLAMLTLMWTSPTVVPFSCETKTAKAAQTVCVQERTGRLQTCRMSSGVLRIWWRPRGQNTCLLTEWKQSQLVLFLN